MNLSNDGHATGKTKTPSTDVGGELRSKNDQSFEAMTANATDHINYYLQDTRNTRDGQNIDYENSPRNGQPQSILKRTKKSKLNIWGSQQTSKQIERQQNESGLTLDEMRKQDAAKRRQLKAQKFE